MGLIIAIPFYPAIDEFEDAFELLQLAIAKSIDVIDADVHVFLPPEVEACLPPSVVIHSLPMKQESKSRLPSGWLTSVILLAEEEPSRHVLIMDYRNEAVSRMTIAAAGEKLLTEKSPSALISVVESKDHPCQFSYYFDIIDSQLFSPVDESAKYISQNAAKTLLSRDIPFVSHPFPYPWKECISSTVQYKGLYEIHTDSRLSYLEGPLANHDAGQLSYRVFLWFEDWETARQVSFTNGCPAALPLFLPVSYATVYLIPRKGFWLCKFTKKLTFPFFFQIHFLAGNRCLRNSRASLVVHEASINEAVSCIDGKSFKGQGLFSPSERNRMFLLNILCTSTASKKDIEVPYMPDGAPWKTDPFTFTRINTETGNPIRGRQDFPQILEPDGTFLGLSPNACVESLASLSAMDSLIPFFIQGFEIKNGKK